MPELRNEPLQAFLTDSCIFTFDLVGKSIGVRSVKGMVSMWALKNPPSQDRDE